MSTVWILLLILGLVIAAASSSSVGVGSLIFGLFVAFTIISKIVRRGVVQPNVSHHPYIEHNGVNPNPELNRSNTSPLAIFQRWQSGIGYTEFLVHNQNNPSGGK